MTALESCPWLSVFVLASCAGTPSGPAPTDQLEPNSSRIESAAPQGQRAWPRPVHDDQWFSFVRAEQLEYRSQPGADLLRWEAQGWYGGDYTRLWLKTEGELSVDGPSDGEIEVQALLSRLIAPFWDVQVGARYDRRWASGTGAGRWFGVVGLQGLSPYEFEVEPALFVSEDGDLSARLTATTDFLITQRLILQPRFETEIAFSSVPEFGVGEGVNYTDLGLRLRYEVRREVAPYIGINWIRWLGKTGRLVRSAGNKRNELAIVFGLRFWF